MGRAPRGRPLSHTLARADGDTPTTRNNTLNTTLANTLPPLHTHAHEVVRLVLDNVDGDLLSSLNGRLMPPFSPYTGRGDIVKFSSRVAAVASDPAPRVVLERALPFEVSLLWRPEVHGAPARSEEAAGVVAAGLRGDAEWAVCRPFCRPIAAEQRLSPHLHPKTTNGHKRSLTVAYAG